MRVCGCVLFSLFLFGCTSVNQIPITRLDGTYCQVTKVNPVWYSSESFVDCLDKTGKDTIIQSNHEDVGMTAGVIANILALIGLAL